MCNDESLVQAYGDIKLQQSFCSFLPPSHMGLDRKSMLVHNFKKYAWLDVVFKFIGCQQLDKYLPIK